MRDGSLFYALTPSYRPVGGVIKVLDYTIHALELGHRVVLTCPKPFDPDVALFKVPGMDILLDHPNVRFKEDLRIAPEPQDLVFFSWPTHGRDIAERLPSGFPMARVIHIVQNVRHANPRFAEGFAVRLLSRPMSRIVINDQVRDAIDPFLDDRFPTSVIPLGHRTRFFHRERGTGFGTPIRVGYTTWKSDIGHQVRDALAGDPRFEFDAIESEVGWSELRELYHWCDVFLAAPNIEEGFYLPGLEAMAAGAVVVTPDVGGNMTYCRFGQNCVGVGFEDVEGYVVALGGLARADGESIEALRGGGREQVDRHALPKERAAFEELLERIDTISPPPRPAPEPPALPRRPSGGGNDVLLAGVPRSGTTLLTNLLNGLPDTVALSEPLKPVDFMGYRSTVEFVEGYARFLHDQRRAIQREGKALSKSVHGEDTDNYFTERPAGDGLREDISNVSTINVGKDLSDDFTLVLKDLPMTTALLEPLSRRFEVFAMVRNPLAALASWMSVDASVREGRSPHAEWFDPALARRLHAASSREHRIVELLQWWFERITEVLPSDRVIRYEDLVSSPGEQLARFVPSAKDLDVELDNRNRNPVYRGGTIEKVGTLLLGTEGAHWSWYERSEVENLLEDLASGGEV